MSENTENTNPAIGFADDGSRIDSAEFKTEQIECMLSRFDEVVNPSNGRSAKSAIFASLAWSYKMRLGRSIVILLDLNEGMAEAVEREQEERQTILAEAIKKTEGQIEDMANLFKWAASQTVESLVPTDDDVISRLQSPQKTDEDTVKEFAEVMGITLAEAKEQLDNISTPVMDKAVKYEEAAKTALHQASMGDYGEFTFSNWNAVSTMEKIMEKAAQYMGDATMQYKMTKVPNRRKAWLSNAEAFQRIMTEADGYAVRYRQEAETAQQLANETDSNNVPVMA
jgi:hypothetical protein